MGCILKGGGGLYARLAVGAVLLAAGEGRRIGSRPKSLLELGGVLECRSNWRIYVEEFCFAVNRLTIHTALCEPYAPPNPMTPFERKYLNSGHPLFRTVVGL